MISVQMVIMRNLNTVYEKKSNLNSLIQILNVVGLQ